MKMKIAQPSGADTAVKGWRDRVGAGLSDNVFPIGLFIVLTGMLWIGRHALYSKLFYWFLLLPALLRIAVQARSLRPMFDSRIVVATVAFACYMSSTLLWAAASDDAVSLLTRPIFVIILFYSVFELGRRRPEILRQVIKISALVATVAATLTLARFGMEGANGRLAGYGALFNPLLVSHVFGFFVAIWFGFYYSTDKLFEPISLFSILLCAVLLVATGSRTPLVAMVATIAWLSVLAPNRNAACVLGALLPLGAAIGFFAPDLVMQRGLSYRPEIWTDVLRQISERVWFGHGYGAPLKIQLDGVSYPFSDPHNLTLAVFYAGGIVGLALWMALYGVALAEAWRLRQNKWVLVCSAAVIYGLAAGMTEGGSFFSRPKEHWFLIWIPLALLAAATYRGGANGKRTLA